MGNVHIHSGVNEHLYVFLEHLQRASHCQSTGNVTLSQLCLLPSMNFHSTERR